MSKPPIDRRYYQLVLMRVKDAPLFGTFLDRVAPLAARHGHGLERMLAPDAIYANGIAKPDIVNVVYYENRGAFDAFESELDLQGLRELRSEALDLCTLAGWSSGDGVVPETSGPRRYIVEVARFGPRGADGYRAYEADADAAMARYGYRVERVIEPESASGLGFEPQLAKIAYFEPGDGMERFHADPAHARIERGLYPAAVDRSIWLTGRVHPSSASFRSVAE
jgi:hypothetical protein